MRGSIRVDRYENVVLFEEFVVGIEEVNQPMARAAEFSAQDKQSFLLRSVSHIIAINLFSS